MKKLLHLFIFLIIASSNTFAQTLLFSDDFESYSADQKLAAQASGSEWTTWSANPGSSEDATISTAQAFEGIKSALIVKDNDLILDLGSKTTGRYQVKFQLYVSAGKSCFVGFMQDFVNNDAEFALSLNFEKDTGSLVVGGKTYEFPYDYDQWMLINTIIDLNDDFATFYIDGKEIASWIWSKGSEGAGSIKKLYGIDFWGYDEANGCEYYIDNVEYNQLTTLDIPLNLTSQLTARIISLNWNSPASGSASEYAVLRNGKVIGKTTNTSYDDVTLIYPGENTYTVKAHTDKLGYSTSSNETSQTLLGDAVQRRVLIEHFTNASCPPCASQNPVFDALVNKGDNASKVVHVAYHTSWPGADPMYNFNNENELGNARVKDYNVSGVPNAVVGGNQFQGGPASITQELIDAEYARPGLFNITSSITIDENDSIFIKLDYTSLTDFISGNLTAYVVLVEDMEYSQQAGTNGEKVFPDVMRYMYPDQKGNNINLPKKNEVIELSFKGKLESELGEPLQLVTFVQNDADGEVYMVYMVEEDFTPPEVSFSPPNGSTNMDKALDIKISFTDSIRMVDNSEIIDPSSIIILKKNDANGEEVNADATINDAKTEITLDPVNDLEDGQKYYITINSGVIENYADIACFADNSTFTTKSTVGLEQLADIQLLNTYPNPCSDKLNIEFNRNEVTSVKIKIYNELGQLIKFIDKGNVPSGNQLIEMDLERIKNGLYFVNITFDSESVTRKIQILK